MPDIDINGLTNPELMEDYETPVEKPIAAYNEAVLKRVDYDDDPNRCQAVHNNLQCPFKAMGERVGESWTGAKYCPRHAATSNLTKRGMGVEQTKTYLLTKWRGTLERHADNPKIKGLREEIGILRMTLETKLNQIKTEDELDMRSGPLMELVREIAKTVMICQKVERENGDLLDKAVAMTWISQVLQIITDEIGTASGLSPEAAGELLRRISDGIALTIDAAFPSRH